MDKLRIVSSVREEIDWNLISHYVGNLSVTFLHRYQCLSPLLLCLQSEHDLWSYIFWVMIGACLSYPSRLTKQSLLVFGVD